MTHQCFAEGLRILPPDRAHHPAELNRRRVHIELNITVAVKRLADAVFVFSEVGQLSKADVRRHSSSTLEGGNSEEGALCASRGVESVRVEYKVVEEFVGTK